MKTRFKTLAITPRQARIYLFFSALLILAPTVMYKILPSHAGRVLVAAGAMTEEPFSKTVIYMTEHHGYSATGFILNKPLGEEQGAAARARFPLLSKFYYGGPVDEDMRVFLMRLEDGVPVFYEADGVMKDDPDLYNALVSDDAVRVFTGYSGWGAFQLNREIYFGAWNALAFDSLFLEGSREQIWNKALESVLRDKKVSESAI